MPARPKLLSPLVAVSEVDRASLRAFLGELFLVRGTRRDPLAADVAEAAIVAALQIAVIHWIRVDGRTPMGEVLRATFRALARSAAGLPLDDALAAGDIDEAVALTLDGHYWFDIAGELDPVLPGRVASAALRWKVAASSQQQCASDLSDGGGVQRMGFDSLDDRLNWADERH